MKVLHYLWFTQKSKACEISSCWKDVNLQNLFMHSVNHLNLRSTSCIVTLTLQRSKPKLTQFPPRLWNKPKWNETKRGGVLFWSHNGAWNSGLFTALLPNCYVWTESCLVYPSTRSWLHALAPVYGGSAPFWGSARLLGALLSRAERRKTTSERVADCSVVTGSFFLVCHKALV